MPNIFETLINVVVGTVSGITGAVRNGISSMEDFFLVRVDGLPFIILGSRQVGKSTLIEWLRKNMKDMDGFNPEPTAAGGDEVSEFRSKIGDTHMKLKVTRDVGGEYAMWDTDWVELFRQAQPRGIIFVMDHQNIIQQKDALNFVMQMIDDEPAAARHLKALFVLVNKNDVWEETTTLDEIMSNYRNEIKRMGSQAERVGYKYAVTHGSLYTGVGVKAMMKEFFNILRPKSRARRELV
jgi:tRNA U34 5-carboxymethylaminomethyl modifying GTPase MnmE/TrmE